ncbi:MAG: bifunctional diaminohydroxyphosphoribosylaminopyrimidine deaminase/5-amino-6-(5-phosphoribosylamino)uracil reductase RibD [Porticoccaceae bacterium]
MATDVDARYMAAALQLARRGWYTARPNPRVGCVIVSDGEIVGEGWHQRAGEDHAEINALRVAGKKAVGATAYVTLEPCSHHGRTPPCSAALTRAGVARVVFGTGDSHPAASGGQQALRAAGISVDGPVLEPEARALNVGFFKRCETGLPWVILKIAASLDGRTAMANGESQWITGAAARSDGQRLRARCGAIITGVGTVLQDNPALTVRAGQLGLADATGIAAMQPLRVIVDSRRRSLEHAHRLRIFDPPGSVLVATAVSGAGQAAATGDAEVCALPDTAGKVDLRALLQELARRECNEVLVEAGAKLSGAFLVEGLVDELVLYLAPKLLGSNAMPLALLPFDHLAQGLALRVTDMRAMGADWRITASLEGS